MMMSTEAAAKAGGGEETHHRPTWSIPFNTCSTVFYECFETVLWFHLSILARLRNKRGSFPSGLHCKELNLMG